MGHQRIFITKRVFSPGGLTKQIDGNDFPCIAMESLEQSKLFGCQGNLLSVFENLCPLKVDLAGSQTDQGRFFLVAAAKDRADAKGQFSWEKWFYQIVVGSQSQALKFSFVFPAGRQKQHRKIRESPNGLKKRETVPVREHHIQDGKIRLPVLA